MCNKIYTGIIVIVAVILAFLVGSVSIDNVDRVMMIIKFFDVMIPVLAVGALLKYLWCGGGKKCGCCGNACSKCGNKTA